MDLILEFRDGIVSGEGADGIGFFGIDGHYYPKEAECTWIKTYFGRHSVEYSGYREKRGIWGTWSIGEHKGGFHIWPIGEGLPLEKPGMKSSRRCRAGGRPQLLLRCRSQRRRPPPVVDLGPCRMLPWQIQR